MPSKFKLDFCLTFEDLYSLEGLRKIDQEFIKYLEQLDPPLRHQLVAARLIYQNSQHLPEKEYSSLLVTLAPFVEDFIAQLFGIKEQIEEIHHKNNSLAPIFHFKRNFIQRIVAKKLAQYEIDELNIKTAKNLLQIKDNLELAIRVNSWLDQPDQHQDLLQAAEIYVADQLLNHPHRINNPIYYLPQKIDSSNLIKLERYFDQVEYIYSKEAEDCSRSGFGLQDQGGASEYILDQANYCIHCHKQDKDSCSKGLKDKETGNFKINEQKVILTGCPLEEKISEMNLLKTQGFTIAALTVAMIDNPLLAATGHRICNDCMKSCIYQKQEPVDIPQIETKTLKDVLNLEWGFEIYSLLTRWNPINFERPLPKTDTGRNVLIVGMGPAGFNLAHHLLNEGHRIVGIDGLKIEPLNIEFEAIYDIKSLEQNLDQRVPNGFGGVAEYGITVRWNKDFLTLIHLLLIRRSNFKLFSGIRFGSNITKQQAFELGFDHIALCIGAGKPNLLNIADGMAKGVRTASDFLMSLQFSGAFNDKLFTNLHIRLPIIVVGGGLTAIDAANESLFYYPKFINKIISRYYQLLTTQTKQQILAQLSSEEQELLVEYLAHYELFQNKSAQQINHLVRELGGATALYRKTIQDSPAYRLNSEEVALALEQGIKFIENATPIKINLDQYNAIKEVTVNINNQEIILPVRTLLIAAGTSPNTTLSREYPDQFKISPNGFFHTFDENHQQVTPVRISKPDNTYIFTELNADNTSISFLGDAHPSFAGNVVKAMASSKKAYPLISKQLHKITKPIIDQTAFFKNIADNFLSRIHQVIRLTPNIIEIVIRSPLVAKNFEPGQFFKLQNFHKNSLKTDGQSLVTEALALTGAWVDKDQGLISTIVLEMGGSSNLCKYFKTGEEIILMGPTGTATELPSNQKVLLIGGGLGNAVLFSIGKALKQNGCEVLYFAGYKKAQDRYKIEHLEMASNNLIWCCDETELATTRPQDYSFHANIIDSIALYDQLLDTPIKLAEIEHIIVIGSDHMMAALAYNLHHRFKNIFTNLKHAIASINSPMQCMMKEICAQCLQQHINPLNGEISYVYSCVNQDQDLNMVDFSHLRQRLTQNSLQEKITKLRLEQILDKIDPVE